MKNSKKARKFTNAIATVAGAVSMVIANTTPVFATSSTGIAQVDTGMTVIKTVAIGLVSVIGVIGMVKGGMDLGTGISQRDTSGITQGAAELGGGLIMAAIGVVIGVMGF